MSELIEHDAAQNLGVGNLDKLITAVQSGADAGQLEQIKDLIEWNDKREAEQAFNAAFTQAQHEFPTFYRDGVVDYQSGGQRTYYRYTKLETMVAGLRPVLKKHGLSFCHETRQNEAGQVESVGCILSHELGHSRSFWVHFQNDTSGKKDPLKAMGSGLSYARRYSLAGVCGIVTTDDDDEAAFGFESDVKPITSDQAQVLELAFSRVKDGDAKKQLLLKKWRVNSLEALPAKDSKGGSVYEMTLDRLEALIDANN